MLKLISKYYLLFLLFIIQIQLRCEKNSIDTQHDLLVCTKIFITIGVKLEGELPIDYYTIREATGDTLRFENFSSGFYPIIDDGLVPKMQKNLIERFEFVVQRKDNSFRTIYEIKSDGCHVMKVSGPETID